MQHKQTAIHCSWMNFVLGVMQRKDLRTFPVLVQALVGDSAGLQNNGVIIEAVEAPMKPMTHFNVVCPTSRSKPLFIIMLFIHISEEN